MLVSLFKLIGYSPQKYNLRTLKHKRYNLENQFLIQSAILYQVGLLLLCVVYPWSSPGYCTQHEPAKEWPPRLAWQPNCRPWPSSSFADIWIHLSFKVIPVIADLDDARISDIVSSCPPWLLANLRAWQEVRLFSSTCVLCLNVVSSQAAYALGMYLFSRFKFITWQTLI